MDQELIYCQAVYISTIVSATVISVAKFSVLILFRRIFGPDKTFKLNLLVLGTISAAWWVAASLGAALRCQPVQSQYDPLIQGHCYSVQHFFIAVEVPNCLLDFAIVALPISVIRRLHLPLKHKITLSLIFLLGSL